MTHELRDYQAALIEQAEPLLADNPVLVMPTGAGKTFTCATLVRQLGMRTLWLAHRRELITQAEEQLRGLGLRTGIILAGHKPKLGAQVQVASVQTLARRVVPRVELVVIDEAHHAAAVSYRKLLAQLPGIPVIGLTATPFRLDGKGLRDVGFGAIVQTTSTAELCRRGVLVEPLVYAPYAPDLKGVRKRAGDYDTKQLSDTMSDAKLIGDIVSNWQERAEGRKTICFAVDVAHSQRIVARFREAGVSAEHLDGGTKREERAAILGRLRDGTTTVLCNVGIVSEGFDLPALDVAIIARPTASLCWHLQAVGRIMRSCEGKDGALVLDHAGNHLTHGFVTDPIAYSLDGAEPAEKGEPGEPRTKACPECQMAVPRATKACPACGFRWPEPTLEEIEGELQLLNPGAVPPLDVQQRAWDLIRERQQRKGFKAGWCYYQFKRMFGFDPVEAGGQLISPRRATKEQKREVYHRFLDVARERGHKDGWAAHRYRDTFGVWPRGLNGRAPARDSAGRRSTGTPEQRQLAHQLARLAAECRLSAVDEHGVASLHEALKSGSTLTDDQWAAVAQLVTKYRAQLADQLTL